MVLLGSKKNKLNFTSQKNRGGINYRESKNPAEAESAYIRALKHDPLNRYHLYGLARFYDKMGQYEKALKTFQQIPQWAKDKQALLYSRA